MLPQPESVRERLRYARSDLELAETSPSPHVLPEMLCFHAQQAAEKAIKAVLIPRGLKPPRIHDIGNLLDRVPADVPRAAEAEASRQLTGFATISRCPWIGGAESQEQYRMALRLARAVVAWAQGVVGEA